MIKPQNSHLSRLQGWAMVRQKMDIVYHRPRASPSSVPPIQVFQALAHCHHPFPIPQLHLSTFKECHCGMLYVASVSVFPSYKAVSNLKAANETGPGL